MTERRPMPPEVRRAGQEMVAAVTLHRTGDPRASMAMESAAPHLVSIGVGICCYLLDVVEALGGDPDEVLQRLGLALAEHEGGVPS